MLSANFFKPKRTAAASRGFLATARLSCCINNLFSENIPCRYAEPPCILAGSFFKFQCYGIRFNACKVDINILINKVNSAQNGRFTLLLTFWLRTHASTRNRRGVHFAADQLCIKFQAKSLGRFLLFEKKQTINPDDIANEADGSCSVCAGN